MYGLQYIWFLLFKLFFLKFFFSSKCLFVSLPPRLCMDYNSYYLHLVSSLQTFFLKYFFSLKCLFVSLPHSDYVWITIVIIYIWFLLFKLFFLKFFFFLIIFFF